VGVGTEAGIVEAGVGVEIGPSIGFGAGDGGDEGSTIWKVTCWEVPGIEATNGPLTGANRSALDRKPTAIEAVARGGSR
jgi:hypothetical protein